MSVPSEQIANQAAVLQDAAGQLYKAEAKKFEKLVQTRINGITPKLYRAIIIALLYEHLRFI